MRRWTAIWKASPRSSRCGSRPSPRLASLRSVAGRTLSSPPDGESSVPSDGRRVLVITYHFPPDGSVGGLRWAGITKYLARLGWKRSEEHTSELQSQSNLVCRLLLEK